MDFKKYIYPLFLLALAYLLFSSDDAKLIVAGITIFLIGMVFMEDGFKLFSGGVMEKVLKKTTSSVPKAIGAGFLATAILQSSSLLTIIVISFLSAELITLSGAIALIFGSNIGSTTTAWIVAAFGVKIKIAQFALPMIIFGVVFRFNNNKSYQGLGTILVGLGFVFLGIAYMKDGFDALSNGINLASYAMDGYLGVLVYVLVGAVATVVIQSSAATMALIITALATGQIEYFNALELAIGANIGTTVTAVLGSLNSNANGKRLAVAHLIFNLVTAFVAIVFLYQLASMVTLLSGFIGIDAKDYAMQLALFHTIFNVLGILLVAPFTSYLVKFLESIFVTVENIDKAKYLDDVVINVPEAALEAIKKEVEHLYDNAVEVLSHALFLHRHQYLGCKDMSSVIKHSDKDINTDINIFYDTNIKEVYGQIIYYATLAQENMSEEQKHKVYDLKVSCKDIVESIKYVRELQKNIRIYLNSSNEVMKDEYNFLRTEIAETIDSINKIRNFEDDLDILSRIELLKKEVDKLNLIESGKIDSLIRTNQINKKMATSLINDSSFAYDISKNLIHTASVLWIKDSDIQDLRESS
ncbi:Na+/Pi-cotransporter [Sulfurimonas gotlandica GD1]|uniref:Na+/Pi-cotransporter n=1 Tax=Sulfurimonas gotlandica (strain DSM 19862 / JCM 16533 / GD1) TaxID=929558 RepID=B6BHW5_SULGG|nr:Na/Pi symporter [Sulfurimonas gotlandica]EDZ62993.1 Na+/Pi-cotransporter [Sulfurimonas gotlandica GD1]EHP30117.1 Na+/Pi-cotransporter [Sulfurimonas gotlandica GD1]